MAKVERSHSGAETEKLPPYSSHGDRVSGRRGGVARNLTFPAAFQSFRCCLQLFLVAMTADVAFRL